MAASPCYFLGPDPAVERRINHPYFLPTAVLKFTKEDPPDCFEIHGTLAVLRVLS